MSIAARIYNFEIPDLANAEAAEEWGRTLTEDERVLLMAARVGLELAALNACSIQDRVNFATTAQLWREAAQSKPEPVEAAVS